jgi:hypothetical protein
MLLVGLDRLARSTRDLLNVLATVSERESGFRSPDVNGGQDRYRIRGRVWRLPGLTVGVVMDRV